MVKIAFEGFDGEIPRMDAHYLPEKNAVEASNCKLTGGTIRALREPVTVVDYGGGGREQIFWHQGAWLSFYQDVDCVPGPVAQNRLYVTREIDAPLLLVNATSVEDGVFLRLPQPAARPTLTRGGTYDDTQGEGVVYAWTWVTIYGEETKPSPPSRLIMWSPGSTITVGGWDATTTELSGRAILQRRIYRSQTTASGVTEMYLIAAISPTQETFEDINGELLLGEPLPSLDYDPAPADLRGLTAMPNGMMVAWSGTKQLCFCEPYMPHAWPIKYQLRVDYNIVGLVVLGSTLMVLTRGTPYVVQGLHPGEMSMVKMDTMMPCVAKRSIVDMGFAAVYASPLGLVRITEGGAQLMSQQLWSEDEWRGMDPSTIRAAQWGDSYVFTHTPNGGPARIKFVNMKGETPAMTRSPIEARAFYHHPQTGELFMLNKFGDAIQKFNAGEFLPYLWRSKRFRFTAPVSFGAFLVELEAKAETARTHADLHVLYQENHIAVIDQLDVGLGEELQSINRPDRSVTATIPDAQIVTEGEHTIRLDPTGTIASEDWRLAVWADKQPLCNFTSGAGQVLRAPPGEYRDWWFVITGTAEVVRFVAASAPVELN